MHKVPANDRPMKIRDYFILFYIMIVLSNLEVTLYYFYNCYVCNFSETIIGSMATIIITYQSDGQMFEFLCR